MQELVLATNLMFLVEEGIKRATCRTGYRDIKPGELIFIPASGLHKPIVVNVTRVVHTLFYLLKNDEIRKEAYDGKDLLQSMKLFYPDFTVESPVTFIEW